MNLGQEWEEARRKAQTDLYHLATKILNYDLVEDVHRPVCVHFLRLDPAVPLYDLSPIKNRLLLDPRGHFKTTIDICHIIQLIITYPDIRVLIVSGTQELAQRMLDEVRSHFIHNETLRALFPECAMSEDNMGSAYEFTIPSRKNWKLREPTITISTIGSVKAGSHFEYIKYDDVVNEVNSETKEQLAKTIFRFQATTPLLDLPGRGYRDVIGTRYDFADLYGWILENNEDNTWSVFKRAACTLPFSPASTILFARDSKGNERFSYKILYRLFKENPRHFGCQYLNDPSFGESSAFKEEMIRNCIIPSKMVPLYRRDPMSGQFFMGGRAFITVDLAFSLKKTADYTVMIVGFWDERGRLFIVDMVRGRFDSNEMVFRLVRLMHKWRLFLQKVGVEKVGGVELMDPLFKARAAELKLPFSIDFFDPPPMKAKHQKIFGLLPLMKNKSFFISKDLEGLEDLVSEFVRFPRGTHDDIPDAVSFQLRYQTMVDPDVYNRPENPVPFPLFEKEREVDEGPLGWGIAG